MDSSKHQVICFGEALWDILPAGKVPGGAPMNVAYHLHKLNKNPALVTRIGIDANGQELMNIFSGHGLCTDFFQVDDKYETGKVVAKANEYHEVQYDIVMPVAWDFIGWDGAFTELSSTAEYFVFGSLAARNKVSHDTLFRLLATAKHKVLDINLRPPHYNRRQVEQLLEVANIVKLNLAELELITGWFSDYSSTEDRLKSIANRFSLSTTVVTLGGEGALLLTDENITRHPGFKVEVADTIGSGDAFLAGLLSQLIDNCSCQVSLEFACGLGAFIAARQGGCPVYEAEEFRGWMQQKLVNV